MSDYIDEIIKGVDSWTSDEIAWSGDRDIAHDRTNELLRAVAEAAIKTVALHERERWENHRLILMKKQYVLNEKLILDTRREFALELLTDNGSSHWHEKHRGEVVCVDRRWLREQAGEGE